LPTMDKWIELVKGIMREQKITQEKLAERVGVSQAAVGHWIGRRRATDLDTMNRVLRELGLNIEVAQILRTAEQRAEYEASLPDLSRANEHDRETLHRRAVYYCYPRLSWSFAGVDEPARADYYRGDTQVSSYEAVGAAYWLLVEGDAMNAPAGLSIPHGMEVLVDPGIEAQVDDVVVVRRESAPQALVRQLADEHGERYLKPLNPRYPVVALGAADKVVGVVVQALGLLR
jgi:SOS-response transcriptional repressor LexA